ncbi:MULTISPECIES: sensor histidine kinase [Streptomyces]|uniref:histidine kinase n=1 Tax=Streptomyces tsukubensis (strain DSM 42081 / NBRC 108919 / NRRL 18488 / 9993) TaxID=1114943 RepID=A0A7G3UH64_STRT9|nr:histidine kinase [Streptomyces tsukubensis]MYS63661.1 sensor histidine kinase [Streptomyces sp. SID5473]QKM69763.1 sensor histidine kinase [Streptomyces tsukubensis NRRL18488]TAI46267.1 sensor histidine kinase [Streptomyces tsukubensis]
MEETVGRAFRATIRLGRTALMAYATIFYGVLLIFTAIATALVVGAGALPETVLFQRRVAGYKRKLIARSTGEPVGEAYLPVTGPLGERLRTAVRDPSTYRDLRWLLVHAVFGWALLFVLIFVWYFGLMIDGFWSGTLGRRARVLPLLERLADLDDSWSRALLEPTPGAHRNALLAQRVARLTETRADAVAAHGAELRRIERDLHDGAQARLVALSMRVGMARRAYETNPELARKLLDDAQDQAEEALAELRHVVRGIHPPILTDRGLVGAVHALASGSGLVVTVAVDGLDAHGAAGSRAPAAVEAAAYFVVAEALTNAAKHSGSASAAVRLARIPRGLAVSVRDEGTGGADESGGSGLTGIRRRVAALDGTVDLTSPTGGPTVIEVELPCVW